MPGVRDDLWLVQRDPVADAIAEPARDDIRVPAERLDRLGRGPAALLLKSLWKVPVVERDERPDTVCEELVDEPVVERESRLVHRAAADRQDARPADRQAVRIASQPAKQADILAPAVVVIARDVSGLAGRDRAWPPAERVPDRGSLPVGIMPAFDLVRGGGRAEEEPCWKAPRERSRFAHRRGSAAAHSSPIRALIPPST